MVEDLNLIRKVVWSYIKTNPELVLEYDDLFSEGCIAYILAEKYIDVSKSEKTTYIWHALHTAFNTLLKRKAKHQEYLAPNQGEYLLEEVLDQTNEPERLLLAKERWEELESSLSPEAQMICNLLINEPEIYMPLDQPRKCRGIISRVLRDRGWTWPKIWSAFRELKEACST